MGAFANSAPLLSIVGLWAAQHGSGVSGVGAPTAITMAITVATQAVMGRLLRRFSARALLALGGLVLGVPTLAYLLSGALAWVLTISAARGVGFGMVTVSGSALVAELVSPHERGRAVGLYGAAVGLPQVFLLPAAVWFAERVGFAPVFWATGLVSALTVVPVALMRHAPTRTQEEHAATTGPGARDPRTGGGVGVLAMVGPVLMMVTAASALGGTAAFLPVAVPSGATAAWSLFALSATIVAGRLIAGQLGDRTGRPGLLLPLWVLLAAGGIGGVAAALGADADRPLLAGAVIAAAGCYGLGFGAIQNDTLVVMFDRAGRAGQAVASAAWNAGYDSGTGIGSIAVGLLATGLGVPGGFAVVAGLIAVTVPFAIRAARWSLL